MVNKKSGSLPEHNERVLVMIRPDIIAIIKYTEEISGVFKELVINWKPLSEVREYLRSEHDN